MKNQDLIDLIDKAGVSKLGAIVDEFTPKLDTLEKLRAKIQAAIARKITAAFDNAIKGFGAKTSSRKVGFFKGRSDNYGSVIYVDEMLHPELRSLRIKSDWLEAQKMRRLARLNSTANKLRTAVTLQGRCPATVAAIQKFIDS